MKNYEEMTQKEIDEIVNRGGDDKLKLNQQVSDYLDKLELSDKAVTAIANTPINDIADMFGGLFTAEAVEEFINQFYEDDEE